MQQRRDLKPFSRNKRLISIYPNGFACQNSIALIGQQNSAKQFYIFTELTCIQVLAKCLVLGRIYKYFTRKMRFNGAF